MSQDQTRGFILKGLYYLLIKYKQYSIVSFFLTCLFFQLVLLLFFKFNRLYSFRHCPNFERLPENFQKLGGLPTTPPPPLSSHAYASILMAFDRFETSCNKFPGELPPG